MTDNEIIKAFKDFLIEQVDGYTDHVETGGERYEFIEKELELLKETDNLINRQKAEKAEQQSEIAILKDSNKNLQELYYTEREKVKKAKQKVIDIAKALKTAKAEAYKEFAERVKEAPIKCALPLSGLSAKDEIEDYFNDIMLQVRDVIDNLLKEMVGDN